MKTWHVLVAGVCLAWGCGEKPPTAEELAGKAGRAMFDREYEEARRLASEAVAMQPEEVEFRVSLAHALQRLERYDEARIQYEEALKRLKENSATDPEQVDEQVMVLVCLNRREEARKVIEEAAERFPDAPTVQLMANGMESTLDSWQEWRLPSAEEGNQDAGEPGEAPQEAGDAPQGNRNN